MFEIIGNCWGFSIALDVGLDQGKSHLALRIWLCSKGGKLVNVRVIAIPLLLNKAAETQFNLSSNVLDVNGSRWGPRSSQLVLTENVC